MKESRSTIALLEHRDVAVGLRLTWGRTKTCRPPLQSGIEGRATSMRADTSHGRGLILMLKTCHFQRDILQLNCWIFFLSWKNHLQRTVISYLVPRGRGANTSCTNACVFEGGELILHRWFTTSSASPRPPLSQPGLNTRDLPTYRTGFELIPVLLLGF